MKTDKIQTIATNKIKLYVNQLDKVRLGKKVESSFMLSDFSDLIKFYVFVKNKRFKQAKNMLDDFDTFIRDSVSDTVYSFLKNYE
jgi:hypothetical protein